jgi:hypothetical protein
LKAQIISEKTNTHPKQIAGDYFVSYTMHKFSAKQDKMYVGRITDAFSATLFHKFQTKNS